jgi:hypothetical protein
VVAAHNLLRWTHLIALPGQTIRTARTRRRRLLTLPTRLTGRTLWRLSTAWWTGLMSIQAIRSGSRTYSGLDLQRVLVYTTASTAERRRRGRQSRLGITPTGRVR